MAGLEAPRSGRLRSIDDDKVTEVINKAPHFNPKGATHWSSILMAKEARLNAMAISRKSPSVSPTNYCRVLSANVGEPSP
ncbi:hypothetical protein [Hydrocarboniclastica marina]|uniref:hypothetical protein n=1 Tax=Hydrocarboniclastica marina TaxID=2259620 RepID=UPI0010A7DCFE|nr:hypothetical protein [Hydrocarboniclastica marina]